MLFSIDFAFLPNHDYSGSKYSNVTGLKTEISPYGLTFLFLLLVFSHSVVSSSLWPHGLQPTRLLCLWDFPGKNTGVGCHFLLQCMKVKSESEVSQSCPTLSDSMDCSPPGSCVCGIFQARVLEWGAIAFSDGSNLLLLLLSHPCRVRLSAPK